MVVPLPVQRPPWRCPDGQYAEDGTCVPAGYWDDAPAGPTLPATGQATDGAVWLAFGLLGGGLTLAGVARKRGQA